MDAEDTALAELAAIDDLRARLRASGTVMDDARTDAQRKRDERDAALYSGLDRYGIAPSGCVARDLKKVPIEEVRDDDKLGANLRLNALLTPYELGKPAPEGVTVRGGTWLVPVWVPCPVTKHKAQGLCMRHYRKFRADPSDWAALGLTEEPVSTAGWRKQALELTGITPWIFSRALQRRIPKKPGYWRSVKSGTEARRLPNPEKVASTAAEQWARVKALNEEADRLDTFADRVQHEVRDPALRLLFSHETNGVIAKLVGLSETQVSDLRRKLVA